MLFYYMHFTITIY